MKLKNIGEVVKWRLCAGCGACAYACPENRIKLTDVFDDGIRPVIENEKYCGACRDCMKVCPGHELTHRSYDHVPGLIKELQEGWGPVLEVWEGYASDPEIRFRGSSGGAATALALYALEKEGMGGVLHTGADEGKPLKNKTSFSTLRKELIERSGSRYSPASPCDSLGKIESSARPSVFIGKPCDVAALRKAEALRPGLEKKVGVSISIFCAGTPSTMGTVELLKSLGLEAKGAGEVRYRGLGWPGLFTARLKGEKNPSARLSYKDAWGFLQKYRQYRCYLCPDGTGEFADISCGDPWYREIREGERGHSLVIARTERGRFLIRQSIEAGYLKLTRTGPKMLVDSQVNLLEKRRTIWGRLAAMKAFGIPAPSFNGFSLFKIWRSLDKKEKIRSILGTSRRIIQRGYYRRKTT